MRLGSPGPSSLRRRWKGKEKETEKEKEKGKEKGERRRDGLARRGVEGTGGVDGLVLPLDMVGTGVYDV
jgi:hypothetical protein